MPDLMPSSRLSIRRLAIVTIATIALGAGVAAATGHAPGSRPGPGLTVAPTAVFHGAGGEPNIAISPDGRTIIADGLGGEGNNEPAAIYRSTDAGRSFQRLHGKFSAAGGGDFDFRWLDNTTVVAVDLSLGVGIYVHRSTDKGLTWTTTTIQYDVYDRPWIEHYGKNKIYVVAKGFDAVPYFFSSTDGGLTFGPPIPLYGTGVGVAEAGGQEPNLVEALGENQDGYVDHINVDPRTGDVYVLYGIGGIESYSRAKPLGASSRLYVAHLEELQGTVPHFVSHPVHVGGAGDAFISGFNWMALDRAGTLYVLGNGPHAGHESTWLSYSHDSGVHWSPLVDVGPKDGNSVFGAIAGATRGVLSLVYLHGNASSSAVQQNWYAEMAWVTAADTAQPVITRSRPISRPVHTSDICPDGILCGVPGFGNDRNLLDYIWNAVGPDGTAYAVISSDGPATYRHGGGAPDVVVLKQTGGARYGPGMPS